MSGEKLTILQMNDSHAYLDIHQELFWDGDHARYQLAGGYARIATLFNNIKEENPYETLVFDCGDTIHGTYPAVKSRGMALIPILNYLGFDAMTAHWEFAYGPEHFINLTKSLDYPMLAINCYYESDNHLVFKPWIIKEVGNLRVGVIGIAATIIDKTMPAFFSKGVYFTLGNEELPYYIKKLRNQEKVDVIVVISHLGFPQEVKLAQEVDGVDILLSSHTHNRLYKPVIVNKTILIQSGCHGSFIGRLDLDILHGTISNFQHQLITVTPDIPPDPEVQEMVDHVLNPCRDKLAEVVGYTSTGLNRNTVLESTMDNFLLKSILAQTKAQIAFSNGWRYGAPVPPGKITLNDLYNIIPMNPPVSTVKLTGREIWMMLEESLEHLFSRDPYNQMGGYMKRCMGLNLYFKVENSPGNRVQEIFIQGKKLKMDETYHAAYVTSQGVPPNYGEKHETGDVKAIDAMLKYLKDSPSFKSELQGTVTAI
ncbi:bifunctional metallophosphatase/5'-nucleotidase [Methanobacterium ferruginis]|uniref:bifunctional metallophosphatase/5'-nucleotidase n=1 Tax=Methanobacterium ferruginis TaxID=710191 RepID=UPI00257361A7|nr:bifunctional metallophosphatase/5'-nucleotidase [Methanobacterium ferruginis]BDZ68688.1 bifunctional metallophosphatase/5'-nucleotidase [Methanobacterium ferruginis]